MKSKFFFSFGIFLILFITLVSAETCNKVSGVNYTSNTYCDTDGQIKNLKIDASVCLNSYECFNQSCFDGKCQSKYPSFQQRDNSINQLNSSINQIMCIVIGEQCCNTADQSFICKGRQAYLCGQLGILEPQGEVAGQCGVPGNSGGPGNGGDNNTDDGGHVCISKWSCTNWTQNVSGTSCGTRTCKDVRNCRVKVGKPLEISDCPGTIPANSVCGDGTCQANDENPYSCSTDCGEPPAACGDGTCSTGESSVSCPTDCKPVRTHSLAWVFWLLVILVLIAIIVVAFLLYRKIKENKEFSARNNSTPPKTPPRPSTVSRPSVTPRIPPRTFITSNRTVGR